jgi:hypothetical protein
VILRLRPGRGASLSSAAMPPATKRFRQRAAFSGVMRNCAAIWLFFRPLAASNTMRARSAKRAESERCRARRSRVALWSGFKRTEAAVRTRRRSPSETGQANSLMALFHSMSPASAADLIKGTFRRTGSMRSNLWTIRKFNRYYLRRTGRESNNLVSSGRPDLIIMRFPQ